MDTAIRLFLREKKVGDTLIVQTGSYLQNVGVVQIHVKNGKVTATYPMLIPAKDVLDPKDSALAKTYGIPIFQMILRLMSM
ncbi:hypothetical protein [uncultured Sphaerochaeta sp.]|uniref:hypothetical protein n=1 Tax=uncultured Sphaerochaeta sp. TaxID=886478 RepID=UPI002A0A4479|nr:hypothetical protein [uncultured Sphaerochaeta sp.]